MVQCVRQRKDGRRCQGQAVDWHEPGPDPVACWIHLTPPERESALANREGRRPVRPSTGLRSSLNKAAFVLALATNRHPGSVNRELNALMGVDRRGDANREQLREALTYAGDRLRALARSRGEPRGSAVEETGFALDGEPPF
jgi:hypothetical protein